MTDATTTRTAPTLALLRAQRDAIIALCERHGATNVRVFGSVARGDATPDSDIDLLVTTRAGVSILDMVGLWLDLKELLDAEVSLVTDGVDDQQFLHRIQRDAVAL